MAHHPILSHPFRVRGNGSIATVQQDHDEANREQIIVLCLTRKGERILVPDFGITDPVFDAFSEAELRAGVAQYGPPVDITSVTYEASEEEPGKFDVSIHFE